MSNKHLYLIEESAYYSDGGFPLAVASSKRSVIKYIKTHYPLHKRVKAHSKDEIVFENDEFQSLVRCSVNLKVEWIKH